MLIGLIVLGGVLLSDAEFRASVIRALARAGWGLEAAAVQIGLSVSRFSKQINGHDPLTFLARAHQLDGFLSALIEETASPLGLILLRDVDLQRLIAGLDRLERRMVKMDLAVGEHEQAS